MWWRKLANDVRNNFMASELMPLKFLFFTIYAGHTTLYPYLAVHMQSLGFGADKAAVLFAIIPLLTGTAPTIAGAVADKIGNFKAFFSGMVAFSGALSLLLLAVPSVPSPPGIEMRLVTDNLPPEERLGVDIIAAEITKGETGNAVTAEYLQWIVLTNTSGCEIRPDYTTHMDGLYRVDIGEAEPKSTVNVTGTTMNEHVTLLTITTHHPVSCPSNATKTDINRNGVDMIITVLGHFQHEFGNHSSYTNLYKLDFQNYSTLSEFEEQYADVHLWFKRGCPIWIPGLCEYDTLAEETISFWSYLGARSILNGAVNAALTLFEGATLSLIKEHDGDYGLQRLWGYLGSMALTPISGYLIDYVSRGATSIDYRPAFYLFVGFQVTAGIMALTVDLKFKPPNKEIVKHVILFLKNPQIIMLFIAMFLAGSFYGFLEAFLFWFLGDLGASRYLMGLTVTVGAGFAIPFLLVASPVVNYFGHCSVISFAFLMYAVRFAGYASISNPYHALWFEGMEGITIGLMLTAAFMYASHLSSKKNVVTLQAICAALYYDMGKGAGSLVGGYMYHHFGARKTFRLFSVANMFSAIIFFIFHLMYIRRRQRRLSQFNLAETEILINETELLKLKDDSTVSEAAANLKKARVICSRCSRECSYKSAKKIHKETQTEVIEKARSRPVSCIEPLNSPVIT